MMLLTNRVKVHQLAQQAIELSFAEGATGAYGQTYSCPQSGLAITYLRTGILWVYSAGSLVMEYNMRSRKALTVRTGKWMQILTEKAGKIQFSAQRSSSSLHFTWTELGVAVTIWLIAATMAAWSGSFLKDTAAIATWSVKTGLGVVMISSIFVAGRFWTARRS